jgi:hypothetical protein
MVLDGPINGVAFQAYVDQVLIPELVPGDIVIMDNLGSHKGAGVRAAIELRGGGGGGGGKKGGGGGGGGGGGEGGGGGGGGRGGKYWGGGLL